MEEPQKIKTLTEEQDDIKARILATIRDIEEFKTHLKFLEKRLKLNSEELEFYKSQEK